MSKKVPIRYTRTNHLPLLPPPFNPSRPNNGGQVLPGEASHEFHGAPRQVRQEVRVVIPAGGQGPGQHGEFGGGVLLE